MNAAMAGATIVLLIANGFNEADFAEIQRALLKSGATIKTVAPENSLSNGWLGTGWGHYFPVDQNIGDALGSDFDMMVLIGGSRGVAKLQTNPHTKRMVGHFLDAEKPLVALNEAVSLLSLPGKISGRRIAGDVADAQLVATGAQIEADGVITDRNLLTVQSNDTAVQVEAMLNHFAETRELAAA